MLLSSRSKLSLSQVLLFFRHLDKIRPVSAPRARFGPKQNNLGLPALFFQHNPPEGKCLNPQLFVSPPPPMSARRRLFLFSRLVLFWAGCREAGSSKLSTAPLPHLNADFKRAARVQQNSEKSCELQKPSNEAKQDAAALGRVDVQAE